MPTAARLVPKHRLLLLVLSSRVAALRPPMVPYAPRGKKVSWVRSRLRELPHYVGSGAASPVPAAPFHGPPMHRIATIGYEAATVRGFLDALGDADIQLLVDVRAVARSRRPGFAKTRLAGNLGEAGIEYLHLRRLGTPAEGRAAARGGHYDELRRIFLEHLGTPGAQEELDVLVDLVRSGRRVCLLCFEADPAHCHRSMVADALAERLPVRIEHLAPRDPEDDPGDAGGAEPADG